MSSKRVFSDEHKAKLKTAWASRKINKEFSKPEIIGNKKSFIKQHNFATVQLPKFVERPNSPFVLYGGDNLYPDMIIQLYHRSALNRRCIDAKIDALLGKGLILNQEDQTILQEANPKETWNEVFEKAATDYVIFGGFALNIIWDETGTDILAIYHLDFSKVRAGNLNDDEEVHQYWYSYSWDLSYIRHHQPKSFTTYSPVTAYEAAQAGKEEYLSQILYYKDYNAGYSYYPLPSYSGAIERIELDISISSFHISNISNGITPAFVINFPTGDPGPDGKYKLFEELQANYSGTQNAGRMLVTFSDGKELAPEVTPLSIKNDNYFVELQSEILTTIIAGHGITSPLLLGIRDGSGGLGNNANEIQVAYQRFLFSTIRPIQKPLLKVFNKLLDDCGYPELKLSIIPEVIFNENEIIDNKSVTDTNVTATGDTKSTNSTKTSIN